MASMTSPTNAIAVACLGLLAHPAKGLSPFHPNPFAAVKCPVQGSVQQLPDALDIEIDRLKLDIGVGNDLAISVLSWAKPVPDNRGAKRTMRHLPVFAVDSARSDDLSIRGDIGRVELRFQLGSDALSSAILADYGPNSHWYDGEVEVLPLHSLTVEARDSWLKGHGAPLARANLEDPRTKRDQATVYFFCDPSDAKRIHERDEVEFVFHYSYYTPSAEWGEMSESFAQQLAAGLESRISSGQIDYDQPVLQSTLNELLEQTLLTSSSGVFMSSGEMAGILQPTNMNVLRDIFVVQAFPRGEFLDSTRLDPATQAALASHLEALVSSMSQTEILYNNDTESSTNSRRRGNGVKGGVLGEISGLVFDAGVSHKIIKESIDQIRRETGVIFKESSEENYYELHEIEVMHLRKGSFSTTTLASSIAQILGPWRLHTTGKITVFPSFDMGVMEQLANSVEQRAKLEEAQEVADSRMDSLARTVDGLQREMDPIEIELKSILRSKPFSSSSIPTTTTLKSAESRLESVATLLNTASITGTRLSREDVPITLGMNKELQLEKDRIVRDRTAAVSRLDRLSSTIIAIEAQIARYWEIRQHQDYVKKMDDIADSIASNLRVSAESESGISYTFPDGDFRLTANGTWSYREDGRDPNHVCDATGHSWRKYNGANVGALLYRRGAGTEYYYSNSFSVSGGNTYRFRMNDRGSFRDNDGHMTFRVQWEGDRSSGISIDHRRMATLTDDIEASLKSRGIK